MYHYVDVSPPGTDTFEVQDLKVGTTYRFAIMSHNYVGESEYTTDIGEVTTKSESMIVSQHFKKGWMEASKKKKNWWWVM